MALGRKGGWNTLVEISQERKGLTLRSVCRAVIAHALLLADSELISRAEDSLLSSLTNDSSHCEGGQPDAGVHKQNVFLLQDMFAHFVRRYFVDIHHASVIHPNPVYLPAVITLTYIMKFEERTPPLGTPIVLRNSSPSCYNTQRTLCEFGYGKKWDHVE